MPRYSALKTALGWHLFNSAIERLTLGMERSYRLLHYEDLVASFPDTLGQICDWLGDATIDDARADDYVAHIVSGNPCRFVAGTRGIQLDDEWRTRTRRFDRMLVALLCGGGPTVLRLRH